MASPRPAQHRALRIEVNAPADFPAPLVPSQGLTLNWHLLAGELAQRQLLVIAGRPSTIRALARRLDSEWPEVAVRIHKALARVHGL
jgi:hypothetical protein